MQICAGLAVVSVTVELGFHEPVAPAWLLVGVQLLAVTVYVAARLREIIRSADKTAALKRRAVDLIPLAVAGAYVYFRFEFTQRPVLHASTIYIAALHVVLLTRLGMTVARYNLEWSQQQLHPARLLAASFVALILTGTLLLALPKATEAHVYAREDWDVPTHMLNCLFTATSAACVTGLTVYDTGSDFTLFGQCVILALIQLGGLGIMIFGSVLGLLIGRQLSMRESLLMQDATAHQTVGEVRSLVVFILVSTAVIEAAGALVLAPMWDDAIADPGVRAFYCAFHAVSAFCNAGFALPSDSLVSYRLDWRVYGCIAPLIVLGGAGFPVLHDGWRWVVNRARRLARFGGRGPDAGPRRFRCSLHTRIVAVATALLIVGGAAVLFTIASLERWRFASTASAAALSRAAGSAALNRVGAAERFQGALFQSITSRTAGFNSVPQDIDSMSAGEHFFTAILMFIGGSPASTAGGIKTTAAAVVLLSIWSTIRGRQNVEVLGRTVPEYVVRRSAVVVVLMFGLCATTTLILSVTEAASLREVLYESVSASATVGLSTGLTPRLSQAGKLVITLAMFAGRLGTLTLMVALAGRKTQAHYAYPEEGVVIG